MAILVGMNERSIMLSYSEDILISATLGMTCLMHGNYSFLVGRTNYTIVFNIAMKSKDVLVFVNFNDSYVMQHKLQSRRVKLTQDARSADCGTV